MHGYADDTQLYAAFQPGRDETLVRDKLVSCIEKVRSWMRLNKLKLNDNKTEFLILGSPMNLAKVNCTTIQIGEDVIKSTKHVRNIGGYFDAEMKMDVQINNTCKSAWFNLRRISKIKPYLTTEQLKMVIHAYVTSRLDGYNALLAKAFKYQTDKLQSIQNCAGRLIIPGFHITPILKELHWLPVAQRIQFKILLLVFKSLHNHGPNYLQELLKPKKYSRCTRAADDTLILEKPSTNLKTYGERSFSYYGPLIWNNLPLHIRSLESVTSFKSELKTHLFKQAYEQQQRR